MNSSFDPHIYHCPKGHYCPAGSILPLKCEPGNYASTTKLSRCETCPLGKYCPTSGLETPTDCPDNMDCQNTGLVSPLYCEAGKYWLSTNRSCVTCPKGKYCTPEPNANGIKGDCDKTGSWICQGGASSPRPFPPNMQSILPSSTDFTTYNGPSYPGYVVDPNTMTQSKCPTGTYRPGYYGTSCSGCPAGKYCPNEGMGSVDAYSCAGGYVCTGNATKSTPTFSGGYICPVGN